jgi:hypothetical protein
VPTIDISIIFVSGDIDTKRASRLQYSRAVEDASESTLARIEHLHKSPGKRAEDEEKGCRGELHGK